MPADREALLPPTVVRGIGDKLYDKRKSAALEVEQLVKGLASQVQNCSQPIECRACHKQYLQAYSCHIHSCIK